MKFILALLISFCSLSAAAQSQTDQAPYKRYPTLPPLQLLLGDSATKYTKQDIPSQKPVLLFLFSPDCSHCQHSAEELLQFREELKDIQIVMATMHSLTQMNGFIEQYRLKELPNLVVGKDAYFILAPFYGVRYLPFMAFYNRKGHLISVAEGGLSIPKVVALFKKEG